jgi:hypothetical protein
MYIARQECCHNVISSSSRENEDVAALGDIAMELMQKYSNDDRVKGIEEQHHWAADSKAVAFLKKTGSNIGVGDLSKVSTPQKYRLKTCLLLQDPLIALQWRREDLKWLVEFVSVSTYRVCKYLK